MRSDFNYLSFKVAVNGVNHLAVVAVLTTVVVVAVEVLALLAIMGEEVDIIEERNENKLKAKK